MTAAGAALAPLPALDPACELTVAIPARSEERRIVATLRAATGQRDLGGTALALGCFDVLLYCNDCDDRTVDVARRFAATSGVPVHVVVAAPDPARHVGAARRAALDLAADRFLAAGRPGGVVASSDADTLVDAAWVAATLAAMSSADAVAGFVSVSLADREAMPPAVRRGYELDLAYRRLLGRCEAALDPRPHDPWPRHDSFNGASFAVSAAAYVRAGRLPPLPALEDQAFKNALERGGERIRHSLDVLASTSSRERARVDGGFSAFLVRLARTAPGAASHAVRSSRATIADATARGLLRRYFDAGDRAALQACRAVLGIEPAAFDAIVAASATHGAAWARLLPLARHATYPDEPVTEAIAGLEAALAARAGTTPA